MKTKYKKISLFLFILFSITYIIPSIIYYCRNGNIDTFQDDYWEHFYFLNTMDNPMLQFILVSGIIIILFLLFLYIVKNRHELFLNKKSVFTFILVTQIIFALGAPVDSSDIFCYLGVARLFEKYHQNPYYTTVYNYGNQLIESGIDESFNNDTVLRNGYVNLWWPNTRISYGPAHLLIFSAMSRLSMGNVTLAIILTKCLIISGNLLICLLLYKLFNNDILYPILYGLNPFVLTQTVINCHNDSIFTLFVLLAFYSVIKENNLIKSLIYLSISANIKFISVIFLPYLVLYTCRNKKPMEKIVYCIAGGLVFAEITIIPWFPFYRDINLFGCVLDQVGRNYNSIYNLLQGTRGYQPIFKITNYSFIILYIIYCFKMLLEKDFKINNNITILFYLMLYYLLFASTNLQYWYFLWFVPFLYFIKQEEKILILAFQIVSCLIYAMYMIADNPEPLALILFVVSLALCIAYKLSFIVKKKIKLLEEVN